MSAAAAVLMWLAVSLGAVPTGEGPDTVADTLDRHVWLELARCESGGRWHVDGRYDGGLQFDPPTWTAYREDGMPAYAWQASPDDQITVARHVLDASGWGQWPACSRRLGYRR